MSDKKIVEIKVVKMIKEGAPYSPEGKTYDILEFYVDGTIDGKPGKFIVKKIKGRSSNAPNEIVDGWAGKCEVDEFRGKVKYTVVRAEKKPWGGGGNFGGSGGGAARTFDTRGMEVGHAINNAVAIVVGRGADKVNELISNGGLIDEINAFADEIMDLAAKLKAPRKEEPKEVEIEVEDDPFA